MRVDLKSYNVVLGPYHGKTILSAMLPSEPVLCRLNTKEELDGQMVWIVHEKRTENTVVWLSTTPAIRSVFDG